MTDPGASPAAARAVARISNQRGLHARAAAKLVKLADQFDAEITVRKGDTVVNGRSIMGLMMLAAGPGCELELSATGEEAAAALRAVVALIARGFDED